MTKPVRAVVENCSLAEAAQAMLANNIGCLLVTDDHGKLAGIVTESDFAAKEKGIPFSLYRFPQILGQWMPPESVERMYAAARTRPVSEIMSRAVTSVSEDDSIDTVIRTMLRTGFHRIPVVANGIPAGMITRHDLLKLMIAGASETTP